MQTEVIKKITLLEELESSVKLIQLGFGELQNINGSNNFYFLPFQLLSQGFERLLKSYICFGHFEKENKFPDSNLVKYLGHDIKKLTEHVLTNYYKVGNIPLLIEDKEFLENNAELNELLFILSEFGKMARYHNFDIITGKTNPGINPKEYWQAFEGRVISADPELNEKLFDWEQQGDMYGGVSRHIIIIFEKYISALSRQFTLGQLGSLAQQYSSTVMDFILLRSDKYGTKDYRKNTTRYKETQKKVHKRNFIDSLNRKYNSNFKSKKINKSEFHGEWPFYADNVIIECRYKHWYIVSIDGYDYALNGSAKGRYKLEDAHDAGMAVLGKSTGDFIQIALNLSK